MITEAIILAGGLGTRLRSAVPDLPKCMAPVAGEPFLSHVISYYRQQGISRFIFSLGYKHEMVEDFLKQKFSFLNYSCSVEDEPLGTGGAILQSAALASSTNVIILNGDTLFAADVKKLAAFHIQKAAACSLVLKTMHNSDRYGVVETAESGRIISFKEKRFYPFSNINGGVYALNLEVFTALPMKRIFSFEKDFLETHYQQIPMYAMVQDAYFIDIGIPEDYERAQKELKQG